MVTGSLLPDGLFIRILIYLFSEECPGNSSVENYFYQPKFLVSTNPFFIRASLCKNSRDYYKLGFILRKPPLIVKFLESSNDFYPFVRLLFYMYISWELAAFCCRVLRFCSGRDAICESRKAWSRFWRGWVLLRFLLYKYLRGLIP